MPPGATPGSVNRGFASVDPERQREPATNSGNAPDMGGSGPVVWPVPARGGPGVPGSGRVRRGEADGGGGQGG